MVRRCFGRMPVGIPGVVHGVVSDGGQVQPPRSSNQVRSSRGRPREKRPELNLNVVESENRRKYKILYVSSLRSSDVSRQVLHVHLT